MSFWQANTKLAIGQKSVAIPAEVQGQYTENNKIIIKVDPSTEFFQPTESYLQFRLKLKLGSTGNAMRLQLNPDIAAHSLLRDVRIMSGAGVVLEECISYNVLVQQLYTYDTNDNVRRKRALTEGTTLHQPLNRSTKTVQPQRDDNATVNNPYFANDGTAKYNSEAGADAVPFTDDSFQFVKICLPLKGSGIFRNPKIFPLMLTQGLRIEILLEEARKCVNQLVQASTYNYAPKLTMPITKPTNITAGGGITDATEGDLGTVTPATITVSSVATANRYADGTAVTFSGFANGASGSGTNWNTFNTGTYYLKRQGLTTVFELYTDAGLADDNIKVFNSITGTGNFAAALLAVTSFVVSKFTLATDNNISAARLCPFVVNQSLKLEEGAGTPLATGGLTDGVLTGKVASIAYTTGAVNLTMSAPTRFDATVNVATTKVLCNTPAIIGTSFNPQYVMDEVELVLQKIVMPPGYVSTMMKSMKEAGMIRYDFNAMQTYKYSMLAQDREGTVMLPLQNSRAKAMLCCPVNASSYTPRDAVAQTVGYAFRGVPDNITEYRFLYNGKLNPDRPVPLSLVNQGLQEQQHLIELDKALAMSSIIPASMRQFKECFIVPRAFALQGGSYDTRSKDFQLQVSYRETNPADGTDVPPVVPKLWHIFVSHIRSIVVQQGNLSVQV